MITVYRIYDHTDSEILADGITDEQQAYETLELLRLEHPYNTLEIESCVKYTVQGLGRDPDLH